MHRFAVRLLFVCFCIACLPAAAGAKDGDVVAELTARKVVVSSVGTEVFEPADTASPGEVIEYRAVYTNRGTGTVRNLEGTLPIPAWTEYLPGTAVPTGALASIDGKIYGTLPLKRKVKYADGRQEIVDIPVAEYRFFRWNLGDLAPAARAEGVLRVRVVTGAGPRPAGTPAP
jgi:uncharacterized repeat protein (TIGR01451 family)